MTRLYYNVLINLRWKDLLGIFFLESFILTFFEFNNISLG